METAKTKLRRGVKEINRRNATAEEDKKLLQLQVCVKLRFYLYSIGMDFPIV